MRAAGETRPTRLGAAPDWGYFLRDVKEFYRRSSAGGSKVIRSHQRRVRETLAKIISADPEVRPPDPAEKPVLAHLPRALDLAAHGPLAQMSRNLGRLAPGLRWRHGYERMPKALADRYAFCELLGPNGPVMAETMILGLVLFAPGTVYPQHAHQEIDESYVSLAGAWSENDAAVYAPGSLILNRTEHPHRITVGDRTPCLLFYAWIGPPSRLAAPGMSFRRERRRR